MERVLSIISIVTFLLIFAFEQTTANPLEIEKKAEVYGKEWNGESIRRSIQLYEESAKLWLQTNQISKGTNNLREIVNLKILLSQPSEALKSLKKAQNIDNKEQNIFGIIENLFLEFQIELNLGNLDKSEKSSPAGTESGKTQRQQTKSNFDYLCRSLVLLP
ncbi:MAG: hypothetical protein HC846_10185 [Blastocatellia bacterium]|nr:hypothetical protein [Blastocatellia bacterium]